MASAAVGDYVTDYSRRPYNMVDIHHTHQDAGASSSNSSAQQQTVSSALSSSSAVQSSAPAPSDAASSNQSAPGAASSRPIDIPQTARQQHVGDAGAADPFVQRRPPQHEFSAHQVYEQMRASHQNSQQAQQLPVSAPQIASSTATPMQDASQPGMHDQTIDSGNSRPAQHSTHPSQSSNPPTSPPSPQLLPTIRSSLSMSGGSSPTRIKVRDLNHIQSFASEEVLSRRNSAVKLRGVAGRADEGGGGLAQKYDIASMPVQDIIEMVAGLLTKITSTNDRAHERDIKSHIPNLQSAAAAAAAGVNEPNPPSGQHPASSSGQGHHGQVDIKGMHRQTQSVLSFHGKNVPSISILMYLSRIHKYCPTTYEVFLSLLVYFDRMTENINKGVVHSFRNLDPMDPEDAIGGSPPPSRQGLNTNDILNRGEEQGAGKVGIDMKPPIMHPFVVDSFNIHRLIMAGVTCASKFFSDVFYTNSRYAKVGGLPLHELNHLELQFLLLNDFKLFIPIDELEYYGSLLVQFYAEEIMTQQLRERQEKEERERKEGADARQGENAGSGEDTADEGVQMQT